MAQVTIDLDAGELDDEPEALLGAVDRVHVACGGHAGDAASMRRTVRVAQAHGVEVGAHPSYPDRAGFGRVSLALPPAEVAAAVGRQCAALAEVARGLGVAVVSAKPHGALYHDAARDPRLADAVLGAIVDALGPVAVVGVDHQDHRHAGKGRQRMGQHRTPGKALPLLGNEPARAAAAACSNNDGNGGQGAFSGLAWFCLGQAAEPDNLARKAAHLPNYCALPGFQP